MASEEASASMLTHPTLAQGCDTRFGGSACKLQVLRFAQADNLFEVAVASGAERMSSALPHSDIASCL